MTVAFHESIVKPGPISFKVESFRRIPCPFERDKRSGSKQVTYIAICDIRNLPSNFPMDTNPREQNLRTKVARAIEHSLLNDTDNNFHLLNRGLLLSAEKVKFNNGTGELTLVFTDHEKHGNVDGGHTYRIIMENQERAIKEKLTQYVRLEIMTGVEDFFESLAGARNTSVAVQDKSLAELQNHFETIKSALEKEPFFDRIAFKENAEGDIDITDIVAVVTMFNRDRFDDDTHPVFAYSGKKRCVNYYLEDILKPDNPFSRMKPIMPDLFKLYDTIERQAPSFYSQKDGGGRYGRIKGVGYKDGKDFHLPLYSDDVDAKIQYETPRGFIYPILAAFRALVQEDSATGLYTWAESEDPFEYLGALGVEMMSLTVDRSRSLGNNPQSVGKDAGHWAQMYGMVSNRRLRRIVDRNAQVFHA
jgi:hypothetical protein